MAAGENHRPGRRPGTHPHPPRTPRSAPGPHPPAPGGPMLDETLLDAPDALARADRRGLLRA
ncbi:hypothetical protein, partial [Streptomyces sp.]|uniref:hypothetical protein n=1 Tax=Streptomyces sp. TaxID=1931 RepID=UPI002F942F80